MELDFTSALYLGLSHESGSSRWSELTTGIPAALFRSGAATVAERDFAALVGCERAVALTSTLHALVDLFGQVRSPAVVLYDRGTYPVARWAMERAQLRGAQVLPFPHHDPAALELRLERLNSRTRPWIVADGFCPGCGRVAPLETYAELARRAGGQLLVDDTQAIGVLGARGNGTLPLSSRVGVFVVASLSKAFGAPLAMLAGAREAMARFEARSDTLVHCSPPSEAHLLAAARALAINARMGDALRARLFQRVRTFQQALRRRGLTPRGGWFPIQRVRVEGGVRPAIALRDALARRGVRVAVVRSRCAREISLTFIVTVKHGDAALEAAAAALARGFELSTELPSHLEA